LPVNTWKVILATMLIFGTGVVTGALVGRNYTAKEPISLHQRNMVQPRTVGAYSPGGLRLEFMRRAQRDLDLSPGQRERVDKILKESQERTRKIMEPVAEDLRAELERTKQEFQEVLTAEQRARFEELMRKRPPHDSHHTAGPRGARIVETNY
jgi:Spy/CpxP family protein refolding chaperone